MYRFLFALLIGFGLQKTVGDIFSETLLLQLAAVILAIGLYGSVHGIDTQRAQKRLRVILEAISGGVVLKILIIGSLLWLVTRHPYSFLLAVIVAQIDPVSIAFLLHKKGSTLLSEDGKAIIRAWSSFDDPMTVLLGVYLIFPFYAKEGFLLGAYGLQLIYNLLFVLGLYALHHFVRKNDYLDVCLAIAGVALAAYWNMFLGIALAGLFLRPKLLEQCLPLLIDAAFTLSIVVVGVVMNLSQEVIYIGLILSIATVIAQIIAARIVGRSLPKRDHIALAYSQYNGITSIGLALFFQSFLPTTVGIIAIAVVSINALYLYTHRLMYGILNLQQ